MTGGETFVLARPARRRRASFVLTSLIDVIFLLVIFFMVSSQIVPFSLIPLAPGASPALPASPGPVPGPPPAAVRILAGQVSIDGKTIAMKDLPEALDALIGGGVDAILLIPGARSTVQDLVSTLEAGKDAGFASMTILKRPVAAP